MASLLLDITLPRRRFTVGLSLTMGRETLALVGPSGSGKTSVLRALSGLERPQTGRVVLDGRTLFDADSGVDVPVEDRHIGFVFQDYALFPHMSVIRNVRFGGRNRAEEMLDRFGIAHLAEAHPAELSGGERQRVALARALAGEPDMLVLDEPLAALDAHTRSTIRRELRGMLDKLGLPVIIVTHDIDDARGLADRVGVLESGGISRIGTVEDVLTDPRDPFIAMMIGANVIPGTAAAGDDGLTLVTLGDGTTLLSRDAETGPVDVIIHPNEITLANRDSARAGWTRVDGHVHSLTRTGARVHLRIGLLSADVDATTADGIRVDQPATVAVDACTVRLAPRTADTPATPPGL